MHWIAYAAGVGTLLVTWLVFVRLGLRNQPGGGALLGLIEGADGRFSTSKFQWLLWTIVVVFSYAVVFTLNALHGGFHALSAVPINLLIAMGFSSGTMAGAKTITVRQLANDKIVKPSVVSGEGKVGALIKDDDGYADLSKIQMIAWTLIAIGVYIVRLVHQVDGASAASLALPDIDTALMVLMGLSQGAYLGKKMVSTAGGLAPHIAGLLPSSGAAGKTVTIVGTALGMNTADDASTLTIDTKPYTPPQPPEWNTTRITFTIPPQQLDGQPWEAGQRILVGVIVAAQESNAVPFTLT